MNPYQDGHNKGYLLGIVHALGSAPDTTKMLFDATMKELPCSEQEYWRKRFEEVTKEREA